jgi:hypothetical protein
MRDLIAHRRTYYPVLARLLALKAGTPASRLPLDLLADGDLITALELLDIEYLDPEVFVVKKAFGEIRGFYYLGGHPFTAKGMAFFEEERRRRRMLRAAALAAGALVFLLAVAIIITISGVRGG